MTRSSVSRRAAAGGSSAASRASGSSPGRRSSATRSARRARRSGAASRVGRAAGEARRASAPGAVACWKPSASGVPAYQVLGPIPSWPCQSPRARKASPAVSARSGGISAGLPSSLKLCTAPWARPMRSAPAGVAVSAIPAVRSRPGRRWVQGAGRSQAPGAISTGAGVTSGRTFGGASRAMRCQRSPAARLSWLPGSSHQRSPGSAAIACSACRSVAGRRRLAVEGVAGDQDVGGAVVAGRRGEAGDAARAGPRAGGRAGPRGSGRRACRGAGRRCAGSGSCGVSEQRRPRPRRGARKGC